MKYAKLLITVTGIFIYLHSVFNGRDLSHRRSLETGGAYDHPNDDHIHDEEPPGLEPLSTKTARCFMFRARFTDPALAPAPGTNEPSGMPAPTPRTAAWHMIITPYEFGKMEAALRKSTITQFRRLGRGVRNLAGDGFGWPEVCPDPELFIVVYIDNQHQPFLPPSSAISPGYSRSSSYLGASLNRASRGRLYWCLAILVTLCNLYFRGWVTGFGPVLLSALIKFHPRSGAGRSSRVLKFRESGA